MKIFDVAIIGAGPAGISCAIQLKRYGIHPVVFEKDELGGLLRNANLVENYPGFSAIPGIKLVKHFKDHFYGLNLAAMKCEVKLAEFDNENFSITTDNGLYFSKILVLASGTVPKTLNLNKNVLNRVLYDITELSKKHDRDIVIVGSGDAAFDYAINLSKFNRVKILNRSCNVKCLPLLWNRSKSIDSIKYMENTEIVDAEINLEKLNITLNSEETINTDYILGAVGRKPSLEILSPKIKENRKALEEKDIFYIIGDAANSIYRQTSIAVGNGIKTAMKIYETLQP